MELNTLLQYKPYSTARTEKRALYAGLLTGLTQFHRERCPEYGRLLDALGCPAHMDCTVESTRRNRVLCRVKPPQYSPRISCSFS